MDTGSWKPYFDPEYENLSLRINPSRVRVDNSICPNCTLITVHSVEKPGRLLEVVRVLSDLDLAINKAYISSDGGWFMDVFHVVNQQGTKIFDRKVIEGIEMIYRHHQLTSLPFTYILVIHQALGHRKRPNQIREENDPAAGDLTAIELIGYDRPGLLSEIFAVLHSLHCNVLAVECWAHGNRAASVIHINDEATFAAIRDDQTLSRIEGRLRNVLAGRSNGSSGASDGSARIAFSMGAVDVDRRLHQLMHTDQLVQSGVKNDPDPSRLPNVTIDQCPDKRYSIVNVGCKDRPKLLLDVLCTLADLHYIVCHGCIKVKDSYAVQEYYIRSSEGSAVTSRAEEEKLARSLQSAILRRTNEGVRLELRARDRVGLLSAYTRVLREHGLSIARAVVTAVTEQARSVFYVTDASGDQVDMNTIEALRKEMMVQNVKFSIRNLPTAAVAQTHSPFSFRAFLQWLL